MTTQQLIDTITTLQQDGKEVKYTVLKSQTKNKHKIMFRGQRTCG